MLQVNQYYTLPHAPAGSIVQLTSEQLVFITRSGVYKTEPDNRSMLHLWIGFGAELAGARAHNDQHHSSFTPRDGEGSSVTFHSPAAAALDRTTGHIHFVDGSSIRTIQPDGTVKTLIRSAGNPSSPWTYSDGGLAHATACMPYGIAVDNEGNVFFTELNGGLSKLRKVNLAENMVITLPNCIFEGRGGMVFDHTEGKLFLCAHEQHKILTLSKSGSDYRLQCFAGGRAGELNLSTDGALHNAAFSMPMQIVCDAKSNFAVLDVGTQTLRRISSSGTVQSLSLSSDGSPLSAGRLTLQCITSLGEVILTSGNAVYILESYGQFVGRQAGEARVPTPVSAASVGADLWQARENGSTCDVAFLVGGQEIKAHKLILMSRSEYFTAYFSQDWQSGAAVNVPAEFSSATVTALLHYLYTDKFEKTAGIEQEVLLLARQWLLFRLVEHCTQQLMLNLLISNCIDLCIYADVNDVRELRSEAIRFTARAWRRLRMVLPEKIDLLRQHGDLCVDVMLEIS